MERKVELLREVKENIEVTLTGDYDHFLAAMVPPLLAALTSTQPQSANTPVQQLRHTALEILRRLPANQVPLLAALCTADHLVSSGASEPAHPSPVCTRMAATHTLDAFDMMPCPESRQSVSLLCSCC